MEKKELLKILCFYLPYQLKLDLSFLNGHGIELLVSVDVESPFSILTHQGKINSFNNPIITRLGLKNVKPILRPLSDFVNNLKDWENIRDEFSDYSFENFINHFFVLGRSNNCMDSLDFGQLSLLLENHFDVFGLIEKGLAIDINTLKKENEPT